MLLHIMVDVPDRGAVIRRSGWQRELLRYGAARAAGMRALRVGCGRGWGDVHRCGILGAL